MGAQYWLPRKDPPVQKTLVIRIGRTRKSKYLNTRDCVDSSTKSLKVPPGRLLLPRGHDRSVKTRYYVAVFEKPRQ